MSARSSEKTSPGDRFRSRSPHPAWLLLCPCQSVASPQCRRQAASDLRSADGRKAAVRGPWPSLQQSFPWLVTSFFQSYQGAPSRLWPSKPVFCGETLGQKTSLIDCCGNSRISSSETLSTQNKLAWRCGRERRHGVVAAINATRF